MTRRRRRQSRLPGLLNIHKNCHNVPQKSSCHERKVIQKEANVGTKKSYVIGVLFSLSHGYLLSVLKLSPVLFIVVFECSHFGGLGNLINEL